MSKITLRNEDRAIIGSLALALYDAKADTFHRYEDRAFGSIADALVHTVRCIAINNKIQECDSSDMWYDSSSFRNQFFASWGGEVGHSAANLVEHILREMQDEANQESRRNI